MTASWHDPGTAAIGSIAEEIRSGEVERVRRSEGGARAKETKLMLKQRSKSRVVAVGEVPLSDRFVRYAEGRKPKQRCSRKNTVRTWAEEVFRSRTRQRLKKRSGKRETKEDAFEAKLRSQKDVVAADGAAVTGTIAVAGRQTSMCSRRPHTREACPHLRH